MRSHGVTEQLSEGLREALAGAGLPPPAECGWEIPRESRHGDYASNAALLLARAARRSPREVAQLIPRFDPDAVRGWMEMVEGRRCS